MIYSLLSIPAIPTHCRRKLDTLLQPGNQAEKIIAVGVHGTTAVMLNTSMNLNVARFRHTHNNVFCIK